MLGQRRQKGMYQKDSVYDVKKIGAKFWGAEKMGLLIPLGKESKTIFRDLVALEQSLKR